MARTAVLGGETSSRGFFGGRVGKVRIWALSITGGLGFIFSMLWMPQGIFVGAGLVGFAFLVTMTTENGTLFSRWIQRLAWVSKVRDGYDVYIPYLPEMYKKLTDEYTAATDRATRRQAIINLRAMRDTPDGLSGFSWLRSGQNLTGIQLHEPPGEAPYLAVTFATKGQVEGLDSDERFDAASESASRFLAGIGSLNSLPERVQYISHIQHADAAYHESWLRDQLDTDARSRSISGKEMPRVPYIVGESYKQLVDTYTSASPVQDRYITVSWPLNRRFKARAARRRPGRDGWVLLMEEEIREITVALESAGFLGVTGLTARQTAALIRHLQIPNYDLRRVADLSPYMGFLPSQESWAYTTYTSEIGGQMVSSLTRTARITAEHMETGVRNSFWHDALLTRMNRSVVRTIAFHLEIIPQKQARKAAAADFTSDESERLTASKKGRLIDAETIVGQRASERRMIDLQPGSGHAGVNWVGYITVYAPDIPGLIDATEAIEDAATKSGIDHLEWLDAKHAQTNANTWPVGRGIKPASRSVDTKFRDLIAGTGAKESL